jgi:hypothetical protein
MTPMVPRSARSEPLDGAVLDLASQMVWRYRRRTGAKPPPGWTHVRWVVSAARWLQGLPTAQWHDAA